MEAVRVSRAGFPVRMLHQDFINRFTILIPPPPGHPKDVAKQVCTAPLLLKLFKSMCCVSL